MDNTIQQALKALKAEVEKGIEFPDALYHATLQFHLGACSIEALQNAYDSEN